MDVERREHAADHRDPERSAELAGRVVDRRAGTGLLFRYDAHDRFGGRGRREPEAAGGDQHLADDLDVRRGGSSTVEIHAKPIAISVNPTPITALLPKRTASRGPIVDAAPRLNATGRSRTPVDSGL